jgi:hypothetical protein
MHATGLAIGAKYRKVNIESESEPAHLGNLQTAVPDFLHIRLI